MLYRYNAPYVIDFYTKKKKKNSAERVTATSTATVMYNIVSTIYITLISTG